MSTDKQPLKFVTESPQQTEQVAEQFSTRLQPGSVIALYGELGAGKTCWVRGLAKGLQSFSSVTSPTFTLIQEYTGRLPIYHFDLYRFKSPRELEDIGYEEYFFGQGVSVVEWPERAETLLPHTHWKVYFQIRSETVREIRILEYTREQASA